MKRIAVIGAGKIGTAVSDMLAGAGYEIIAVDQDAARTCWLVSVFSIESARLLSPLRISMISEQAPVATTTRISAMRETFSQSFMR